jgi:hypothetical protein
MPFFFVKQDCLRPPYQVQPTWNRSSHHPDHFLKGLTTEAAAKRRKRSWHARPSGARWPPASRPSRAPGYRGATFPCRMQIAALEAAISSQSGAPGATSKRSAWNEATARDHTEQQRQDRHDPSGAPKGPRRRPGHRRTSRGSDLHRHRRTPPRPSQRRPDRPEGRKTSGITRPIGPHTLRHAFITAALDGEVPLHETKKQPATPILVPPRSTTGAARTSTATPPTSSWPSSRADNRRAVSTPSGTSWACPIWIYRVAGDSRVQICLGAVARRVVAPWRRARRRPGG